MSDDQPNANQGGLNANEKAPLQKNKSQLLIDKSKSAKALQLDMPEMRADDDISFNDGDQSPILNEQNEKEKLNKLLNKIAKVTLNLKAIQNAPKSQFPKKGTCRIIKSQFRYQYSVKEKQLKLL